MEKISKTERIMFAIMEVVATISFVAFVFFFCWAISKFATWVLF
jgi:hypothetical protein